MSKIKKGILGGFSGKVGNVVGSFWKGKATMRSLPGSMHNPRTDAQMEVRMRFSLLTTFCSRLYSALAVGFRGREDGTTFMNEAMRTNYADAVTGTYPTLTISYANFQVSEGNLTNLGAVAASNSGTGDIDITWQDNSGQGTAQASDEVYATMYNKDKDVTVFTSVGVRGDATYSYTYPNAWTGDKVEVYLFAQDEEGKCSRSQYLGEITC